MRIPRRLPTYPYGDNELLYFGDDNDVGMYWDGSGLTYYFSATRIFRLYSYAGGIMLSGGAIANGDLKIEANSSDSVPSIELVGAGSIYLNTTGSKTIIFQEGGDQTFLFSYAANVSTIAGTAVNADELRIRANTDDTYPYIKLTGNSGITLYNETNNSTFIYNGATLALGFCTVGADYEITSYVDNTNIFLKPSGTGKIKFGTYTAGAALASEGYITIVDAGGTTRKLMVQA